MWSFCNSDTGPNGIGLSWRLGFIVVVNGFILFSLFLLLLGLIGKDLRGELLNNLSQEVSISLKLLVCHIYSF